MQKLYTKIDEIIPWRYIFYCKLSTPLCVLQYIKVQLVNPVTGLREDDLLVSRNMLKPEKYVVLDSKKLSNILIYKF
jgi:hypothetical protein